MTPIALDGDAYARGRGQALAAPEAAEAVREAVAARLGANADLLAAAANRDWLAAMAGHLATADPDGAAELAGIADGFAIPGPDLFAFLHMAVLRETAGAEGCSAFAVFDARLGAVVGKNRDLRGPQLGLQRVFLQRDPAWGGRRCLFVGSLGAPGAYSSGVNSDGLALADTQIATGDHGVGLLRYFVMTRLLSRCATVAEALAEIGRTVHAGGGSIVIADRSGAVAAVELGHSRVAVETAPSGFVARANRFVDPAMAAANLAGADADRSESRRARLLVFLAGGPAPTIDAAKAELASHDDGDRPGLCRHGGAAGSNTVSGALFATAGPTLYVCDGAPCTAEWRAMRALETPAPDPGRPS